VGIGVIMGYVGKILRVNLNAGKCDVEGLDYDIASKYIGGRGYGVKVLFHELKVGIDPFSEENKLIFMTGPLTGLAPASGRSAVISKSPLTGGIFDANTGGSWGVELKKAGFDGIIIEGASKKPVYLSVKDGKAELKSAEKLWGKNTFEVKEYLEKEEGGKVACIGLAGENLVKYACIMNDGDRTAGRGGLGAVMGAKKLKAIVVKGENKLKPVNEYAFQEYYKKMLEILKGHPLTGDGLGRFGTLILVNPINKHGIFPIKNFRGGYIKEADQISGETMSKYLVKKKACALCPIACGRIAKIGETETSGPEYETTWALGPQCGITDAETIAKANNLCNDYGLDTISMGNTLGFAMECSEKGLIKEDIRYGDGNAVLRLIEQTARREGLGNLLAEGTKRISEKVGGKEFAIHVKGLELPAYDPRGVKGQALAFCTSNRGGCHLRGYMIPAEVLAQPRYLDNMKTEGKAKMVKELEEIMAVLDSLSICKFTIFAIFHTLNWESDLYAKLLTTATGFYFDEKELRKAGERIFNLERCFNLREGFTSKDDALPARFKEPIKGGPADGAVANVDEMLSEYYQLRGWDENGVPGEKKLAELGIGTVAEVWPKLQVALDLRSLDDALKLAKKSAKGGADWIEVGTPLIKSAGMEAVRRIRELFPNKIIVADLKTMDTGFMEVELAAQAGADIIGVAGAAGDHTIADAVGAGKKFGVKIMADLISIKDPVKRAVELEKLGVDYLEFHISVDEQLRAGNTKIPFPLVQKVVEAVKIPVAVAGGMRVDTVPLAIKSGAKIAVVGGAITRAGDAESATRAILKAMGRIK